MANYFDQFDEQEAVPTTPVEPQGNYFDQFDEVDQQPTPTDVLSGQDPQETELNRMRDEGELDVAPGPSMSERGVRTYDELYGNAKGPYRDHLDLREYEQNRNTIQEFDPMFDEMNMTVNQKVQKDEEDRAMQDIYNRTGKEKTVFGVPIRVQTERKNNPAYDPNDPASQPFIENEFLVDKPDSNALTRIGYQLFENIVGGVGDFVTEGKLTEEGSIGKSMPDVAQEGPEAFATELTTYIVGPAAVQRGLKTVGQAGKMVGASTMAPLVGQVAKAMSPEAQQAIRTTYQTVLKKTGDAKKAFDASNSLAKRMTIGMSLGLKEAIVAPDGSQGLVPPEAVQKYFGIEDPERARDVSFMLDTPIIAGTLNTLGGLYTAARDKVIAPTFGGIRNFNPLGGAVPIGKAVNKMTLTEKDAGLKTLLWIDPNLKGLAPEDFIYKTNVLAGALERKATKDVQLAGAGKEIKMDTPAAFVESAKDYYSLAYENLKESMGAKEFNDWVSEQATATTNRLFELRSAVIHDPDASSIAKSASELESLFDDAAQSYAPDGKTLPDIQGEAGQKMSDAYGSRLTAADDRLKAAEGQMEASKTGLDTAITRDPDFKEVMEEAASISELGSNTKLDARLKEVLTEPMYQSFKKLKGETDAAYKAVGDAGAEAEVSSLLQIIDDVAEKKTVKNAEGVEEVVADVTDPVLKRIANQINTDPSFANIYNNVRKTISDELKNISNGSDPFGRKQTLLALKNNIEKDQMDFLIANGDGDVVELANKAKQSYIDLRSSWGDEENLKRLTDRYGNARMKGENMPQGVTPEGQGVTNWDIKAIETVTQGLDGPTGELFRQSLDRAVTTGGQNLGGFTEYLAAKSLSNLSNRIASGNKESVGTLRQALKSVIGPLEGMKSPLVTKLKKLEGNIQSLENVAKNDEAAYLKIKDEVADLHKEAQNSILKQFVFKGDASEGLSASGVDKKMKSIFGAVDSENRIREILRESEKIPEGAVIKDALKGTYLDYLKGKVFSRAEIGGGDVVEGTLKSGHKANQAQISKIFAPTSKDMDNLKSLYADEPEVLDQINEAIKLAQNMTKTTPRTGGDVLGTLGRELDPSHGINSLILTFMGQLNPTATKARRITGPISVQNLKQVEEAQRAVLMSMLTDPKELAEITKKINKGIQNEETLSRVKSLLIRAGARAAVSGPVDDEMEELQ